MNSDTAYQNRDLNNQNPLAPVENTDIKSADNKHKTILPEDPKIRLLVIMAAVVFILLIISIVITTIRKSNPPIVRQPIPTPIITPTPAGPDGTGYSSIPDNYKTKFGIIDDKIQTDINFSPPQITDDIGL